jgi:hypothetical protein
MINVGLISGCRPNIRTRSSRRGRCWRRLRVANTPRIARAWIDGRFCRIERFGLFVFGLAAAVHERPVLRFAINRSVGAGFPVCRSAHASRCHALQEANLLDTDTIASVAHTSASWSRFAFRSGGAVRWYANSERRAPRDGEDCLLPRSNLHEGAQLSLPTWIVTDCPPRRPTVSRRDADRRRD